MKKLLNTPYWDKGKLKGIVMKLTMVKLVLIFSLLNSYASVYSQAKISDLSLNKTELSEALKSIEKLSDYTFIFNYNDVIGHKVTAHLKDMTINECMENILKDKPFSYKVEGDIVIVSFKKSALQQVKHKNIKGTVTDKRGNPLPGVTVMVKGTSMGVATDINGKFKIDVEENAKIVLVFSFVGMNSKEIAIKENKDLKVILEEAVGELEEVVITGYVNKSKESFTGSVTAVKGEELLKAGSSNLLQSLQAFVPGMQIVENNDMGSDPNTKPDLLIRGRSSFSGGTNVPTFILDGAEVTVDDVFDLDMNDVETVTVLKDASASALYGSKAANGVIVITTKSMRAGTMKVSYNGSLKVSAPDLSDYDLLNAEDKLEYERLAGLYTSQYGNGRHQYPLDRSYNEKFKRVREGVDTYWLAKPLRTGITQNHTLRIYGGNESTRYSLNVRAGDDQGVMKTSYRKRYSLSFKLSYNIDQKIYFNNTASINSVNSQNSKYGSFGNYAELNPYDRAKNADGTYNKNLSYGMKNPLLEAALGSYDKAEDFYFRNNFDVKWTISDGFRVEGGFSITKRKNDGTNFKSPESKDFEGKMINEKGSISIRNNKDFGYQAKLVLSYNKTFGEGTLLTAVAGGNVQEDENNTNNYRAIGLLSDKLDHPKWAAKYPDEEHPGGNEGVSRLMGGFLNLNFMYNNRYFADMSLRYEGSSKYGKDKRFAPFWSLGGGWNIHNESFMNKDVFSRLKLRGSVGYVGNASFEPYQALTTYEYKIDYFYKWGVGAVPMTIGNSDLAWERTLNYNAGLDMSLFNGRVDIEMDYYKKVTNDLLIDVTKAPSVGVESAKQNLGKIENTGLELKTRIVALRSQDWEWSFNLSASHNKNKIVKISEALKAMNDKTNSEASGSSLAKLLSFYEEGQSTTAVKVVKSGGIDPATGKEVYIDRFGNPTFVYDYRDKRVYGDGDPDVYGILGSYLGYKGFSINLMLDYRLGATTYNSTLVTKVEGSNPQFNADQRVFDSRWKKPGDISKYKDIADTKIPQQTDRFVEDEYKVSLRSLNLAYDVKSDFCKNYGLSRLRLEFMMNDVFTISSIKQERGLTYPFARSFQFSVSATF